jgi:photosystem II stability/assembly factor-like uncharacterized protein
MKLFFSFLFLLTTAANAQWNKIDVPTTATLRGLSTVGANVVWASGTQGTVIRTVDDGKSWSVMVVPGAETLDFRGIHAFDNRTAIVISSGPAEKGQARIYRTDDGGKTWRQVYEQITAGVFFDAIVFWDRKHGIVLSDPVDGKFALFRTDDGGASWKEIPPSALPPALPNEGAFAASNSCLTVQGDKNVWFATGGAKVARVFRSNDQGNSWSVTETLMHPANASSGIFSLAFQDVNNGIAAGGDYAHPESSDLPNVLVTSDGGQSWQGGPETSPEGMYLSAVSFSGARGLVAVGVKGLLARSGSAWTREAEDNLNAVVVRDGKGWSVGAKGTVLRGVVP